MLAKSQKEPRLYLAEPPKVSVVIPLYNEAESLRELYGQIKRQMETAGLWYEIIFVDDGSSDTSFEVLRALHEEDIRVKVVRFRTNFGKAAALSVGFERVTGDVVVTMDADLQDDPDEIPNLLTALKSGADIVSGWKRVRRDPWSKRIPSKIFNNVVRKTFGLPIHDVNCGLKAYRAEAAKALAPVIHGEMHRYIPVIAHWQGYRVGEIEVNHRPRAFGKSKYGLWRFFAGFFDLVTVWFLQSFMRRPLHLFGLIGLGCFASGGAILGYFLYEWIVGDPIRVRPLILVGVGLVLAGIQFFSLGLLGELSAQRRQHDQDYVIKAIIE